MELCLPCVTLCCGLAQHLCLRKRSDCALEGCLPSRPTRPQLSLLSCRRGFERGAVRPSALQDQVGNVLPAFWYLGGTFRPEVVAVLESRTQIRHIFIPVNRFLWWNWGWAGLKTGWGEVGSREAERHHGSFSCASQILIPLNINFLHSRLCKIGQVEKVDFEPCPSESRVHVLKPSQQRDICNFF